MADFLATAPSLFLLCAIASVVFAAILLWPSRVRRNALQGPSLRGQRLVIGSMAVVLPLLALLLYLPIGASFGALDQRIVVERLEVLQSARDNDQRREGAQALLATLKEQTDTLFPDPSLLELYGAVLASSGQHSEAIEQYQALLRQQPDDADLLALLAETEYLRAQAQQQGFPSRGLEWLEQALALDPMQPRAQGLAGIHAFSQGRYQDAITAWRRAASVYPPGSDERRMVESGIAAAQQRMGLNPPAAIAGNAAGEPLAAASAVLTIAVSVADSVDTARIPAHTPVFLFAKRQDGAGPPLAAKRLTLGDLPATLQLTQADAMMGPGLEAGMRVQVTARLALSGQPIAQTGDIQSPPVTSSVASSIAASQAEASVIRLVIGG